MDEPKLQNYIQTEIERLIFGGHKLLVWDAFKPYFTEETRRVLRQPSIDLAVIPGIKLFDSFINR